MSIELLVIIIIILAGFYMAWNIGANDAANAVGTSVGSHALTLRQAVIIAAVLEFSGALFFGSHVTTTIEKGLVDPAIFSANPHLLALGMLASLLAAGTWMQIASSFALPVSTTHSIVGAIIGFGLIAKGVEAIWWKNVALIAFGWVLSPLISGTIAFCLFNFLRHYIFYKSNPVEKAKRWAPFFAFFLTSTLTIVMSFKGIKQFGITFSFVHSLILAIIVGSIFGLTIYFLAQRIKFTPKKRKTPVPEKALEISISLKKAQKHLKKVKGFTSGDLYNNVSLIDEAVEDLSRSFEKSLKRTTSTKEFGLVEKIFAYLQVCSVSLMAFSHGANDVANAIAPIAASIHVIRTNSVTFAPSIPLWILIFGGMGITIGLITWGWRVIETIGKKITSLTPTRGFTAEFGAALTIFFASRLGLPVSSTHILVGAVIGVGLARGIEALNLSTIRDIVLSWFITIPAGIILSIGFYQALKALIPLFG